LYESFVEKGSKNDANLMIVAWQLWRKAATWETKVPIGLSNGVSYGFTANEPNQDMIFTLVQPLKTPP
jgi:hypothetical protein